MFSVYGRMVARPGKRDELIAVLLDGFRASREGGLLAYSINALFDNPDTIWLTQLWIDKEAHDATTRCERVAAASRQVLPLLAQQPEGFYGKPFMSAARPPHRRTHLVCDAVKERAGICRRVLCASRLQTLAVEDGGEAALVQVVSRQVRRDSDTRVLPHDGVFVGKGAEVE